MKLFFLKAFRDLKRKKTRSIPILLVIIIGGMATAMYSNLYFSLEVILDASWEDHNHHHLLITTKPNTVQNLSLAANNAIAQTGFDVNYEVRGFYQVQVEFAGKWVTAHLYGIDEDEDLTVDQLYYHTGYVDKLFESTDENVVLVEKFSAEENNWIIGDDLNIKLENSSISLETIALVDSPEYIIKPGPATDFFGIWDEPALWMKLSTLKSLILDQLAANQISFHFDNPSQKNEFLEVFLTSIGVENVLNMEGRSFYLEAVIAELSGMSIIMTIVFVGIASLMLFIVLKRIVEEETATFGLFKGLGFTNREIIMSSFMYSLIISVIGGFLGSLSGLIVGLSTTVTYVELIGIKVLPTVGSYTVSAITPVIGYFLITILMTSIGSLFACRKLIKLQPAEAMRPKAKFKAGKIIFIERIASLIKPLSPLTKFSIRSLFQEKRKSIFIIMGIFLATFISLFGSTIVSGYLTSVDKQFNYYQQWDDQIIFNSYYNSTQIDEFLQRNNLVSSIDIYEPVVLLPIRFSQEKTKIYSITGLLPSTVMRQFDNARITENNLIITKDIALQFNLKAGSNAIIEVYGTEHTLEITEVIQEFSGSGIFCSINTTRILANIPKTDLSNGLYIKSSEPDLVETTLSEYSEVFKVINKHKLQTSLNELNAVIYLVIIAALFAGLLVGVAIAVTIVSISISERRNDFINFRAFGVSNKEIFISVLLELLLTGIGGLLIGFIVSIWLVQVVFEFAAMFGLILIFELTPLNTILTIVNVLIGIILAAYLSLRSLFKSSISEETVSRIIG